MRLFFLGAFLAIAGVLVGFSLGAPSVFSKDARLWETVGALGAAGSAIAAVWLGLREGRIRRQEATRRAKYASAMLLPEFRKYLHGVSLIQGRGRKEVQPDALECIVVSSWAGDMVLSLLEGEFEMATKALSHLRHAERHLQQIYSMGKHLGDGPKGKVDAVQLALHEARGPIAELVKLWADREWKEIEPDDRYRTTPRRTN